MSSPLPIWPLGVILLHAVKNGAVKSGQSAASRPDDARHMFFFLVRAAVQVSHDLARSAWSSRQRRARRQGPSWAFLELGLAPIAGSFAARCNRRRWPGRCAIWRVGGLLSSFAFSPGVGDGMPHGWRMCHASNLSASSSNSRFGGRLQGASDRTSGRPGPRWRNVAGQCIAFVLIRPTTARRRQRS